MKAVEFFEGIGILARYGGDMVKHPGAPINRVRMCCVQFGGDDAKKLRENGFVEDASQERGTTWYCDT